MFYNIVLELEEKNRDLGRSDWSPCGQNTPENRPMYGQKPQMSCGKFKLRLRLYKLRLRFYKRTVRFYKLSLRLNFIQYIARFSGRLAKFFPVGGGRFPRVVRRFLPGFSVGKRPF